MPKETRKGRFRISIDIPKRIYEDVRALAFHENTTLTIIITKALVEHINSKKEYLVPYRKMN